MSLVYRGIWRENRSGLCELAVGHFQDWLTSKSIAERVPDEGQCEGTYEQGSFELLTRRALHGLVEAVQVELVEEKAGDGERWTTRLTAIDDDGTGERWVWVDLLRVADEPSRSRVWAAPRLSRTLIEAGADPRVDQVRIETTAYTVAPAGLLGLIRNTERTLPIIVFSEDPVGGFGATQRRANTTARRLAGAVQVMILTAPNIAEFNERTEEGLGVWGGAARLYLPNAGTDGLRPERHRYVSGRQLGADLERPAAIFALLLSGTITARRPPAVYESVRRELRLGRGRSDAELLAVAEYEIAELRRERDDLKELVRLLEDELLDTQVDYEEAVRAQVLLGNQLQVIATHPLGQQAREGTADLAIVPESITDAIAQARTLLGGIVIPDGVERDIEDLESAPNANSWAAQTWRGLRALHLYAEADHDGDFRHWCQFAEEAWSWTPSDKHLAMTESETVRQQARLARQRNLPVDERVDPSGRIHMWSHLKIAEGGGPLAPRVYFHDDTRGPTGRVHIGFIGPHRYMENTRTN